MSTHVERVHVRLAVVVESLMGRVAADRAEIEKRRRELECAEDKLKAIAADVTRFLSMMPGVLVQLAEAAREKEKAP